MYKLKQFRVKASMTQAKLAKAVDVEALLRVDQASQECAQPRVAGFWVGRQPDDVAHDPGWSRYRAAPAVAKRSADRWMLRIWLLIVQETSIAMS